MNKIKGFTLIELMIVVAIIGILAAVAYPSYQDSVKKSRRGDAQAALTAFSQAMEQQYTIDGTYATANGTAADISSSTAPTIFATQAPIDGSNKFYNLTVMSANGTAFVLRATPFGAMAGDGYLEITSTALKRWKVYGGTVVNCWTESC